ncbi:MAG: BamA/TamA family outer membrane protein [candidate division KSB1 bacterium]|nr:BamA/TamA family outer membrane protein [candidate division KSB1 bacterium]MDZ7406815.1 BamA/TamA family outer membrane protein [candidate division KSB1 bacterium]
MDQNPARLVIFVACLFVLIVAAFATAQDNYEIKKFKIEGVRRVSKDALREALATRSGSWYNRFLFWRHAPLFSTEEFQRDLRRILEFYQREGFFHARIDAHEIDADDKKQHVRLRVKIAEEQPTQILDFQLAGTEVPRVDQLFRIVKSNFKPGDRLRAVVLRNTQVALAVDLTNHGFPFASVETQVKRDETSKTAVVVFRVNPGPACVFGDVQVTGASRISPRTIHDELPFEPGQVFNQSKLIEAQQRVYRLELFQYVSIRAASAAKQNGEIPIEIRVREAPARTLKIGVGYGTEELFRGTINFRRRNFLGGARRLDTEAKYSDLEPGRVQARIFQPHFFDAKTGLIISPFYLRRDEKTFRPREKIFSLRSFGGELVAQRQFNLYTNLFLRYRLEDANVTPGTGKFDSVKMQIPRTYRKASWGFGILYNSGQPLFSPTRGRYYALQLDYSGPLSEFYSFRTEFHYLKTVVEGRMYRQTASNAVVMAYRLKLGSLEVLDDPRNLAPLEERFYSGGSSSVRGWQRSKLGPHLDETPIGGQSLLEGSVEARFKLYKSFGAALFVDFGNVWETSLTYKLDEIRYATGWGWRYDTPIGPIRLDAARKSNLQAPIDKHRWEFYLSVGQAF